MAAQRHLRLLPPIQEPISGVCRTTGCCSDRTDRLGFCDTCHADYEWARAQVDEIQEASCVRVRAALPDLFEVLEGHPKLAQEMAANLAANADEARAGNRARSVSSLTLAGLSDYFAAVAESLAPFGGFFERDISL